MMTGSRVTLGLPRSAVLYCALLALSFLAPLHASEYDSGPNVVSVKRYFGAENSHYERKGSYVVSYQNADSFCGTFGAFLPADQTEATHNSLEGIMQTVAAHSFAFAYLGGDAAFSASSAFEMEKRCNAGAVASSSHCVYRWNKGILASASTDGHGFPFWRGSFRRQGDAVSLNGYPSFWGAEYPKRGELYTLFWLTKSKNTSTWYDGKEISSLSRLNGLNDETKGTDYSIVCEVQDYVYVSTTTTTTTTVTTSTSTATTTTTSTTEAPTEEVTSEPTATAGEEVEASPSSFWTLRDWRSILLVSLLLGAVVVLLLVVVCCCCRCCSSGDGAKETSPMTLRETVGERGFAVMPMSVVPHRDFHDDSPSAEHYGQMGSSKTL